MASDLMQRNNEKLSEISERLKQSHLSYLQTEDSPLKFEQRGKLESVFITLILKCFHSNLKALNCKG